MFERISAAGIADIAAKLDARERLSLEDGVRLFECPDLLAVGHLANLEHGTGNHAKLDARRTMLDISCELVSDEPSSQRIEAFSESIACRQRGRFFCVA